MIVEKWTRVEVLAIRLAALRLTQEKFAELIGFQPSTIRKWERATRERPVRGDSAAALDTQFSRLTDEQRARFRSAIGGAAESGVSVEVRAPSGALGVEDDVKRRQFGMLVGAALVAAGTDSAVSHLGMGDARRLSESVTSFASREQAIGGVSLVQDAINELELALSLLETTTFDESTGRAFMSAAGELATIAGWLAYDADLHGVARRCYADAFALASQAGDDELTVHVCLNTAHQAIALSRIGASNPRRALGLLGRARDFTRGRPPGRIHALIATREALAYGLLGDRQGFGKAVATAWRELDAALDYEPLENCPRWLRFVTPTEVRCHEARGFGDLGNWMKSADLSAGLALEAVGARNAANYRAGWAAALAGSGDANSAVTQGLSVLDELESSVSSTRTLRLLEPIRDAVGDQPGDEFGARFDELARKAMTA